MSRPDRLVWPLIGATALGAMVAGHAIELWLESHGVFGDGRATYVHSGQMFALELAGASLLLVAALVVRMLVRSATHARSGADCVLPALHGVARLGLLRIGVGLLSIQFGALLASELLEERWSGFTGNGIGSIFGPGHATALAVHLIIGSLAAFALLRVSRYVCAQTRALVKTVAAFLRRTRVLTQHAPPPGFATSAITAAGRKLEVLSLGIANRPPPPTFAIAA
jgi:hypothetical protein